MDTTEVAAGTDTAADIVADDNQKAEKASRRWRALWRTHFYAGVFAAPALLMFAITGLFILYTQPYQDWTQHDLRQVSAQGERRSFDAQKAAVQAKFPENQITSVVVPPDGTTSTQFGLDNERIVFVNPYTTEVLGSTDPNAGVIALSNRLHGNLNNDTATLELPNLAGLFDGGPIWRDFVIGDMVLEIFACWAIVLVASGLYLWWPRKSRNQGGRSAKGLVVPRVGKKGRARWRDLHAIPGMLLAIGTLFVLMTGLFWSDYWAATYSAVANKVSPPSTIDPPSSSVAKLGELDRLKNAINWNTADTPIPNSAATDPAALPKQVSLDTVVEAAKQEGMLPGYSISYPEDGTDDVGNPTYGSFTLANSWPRKTSEAKTVYLDQFTGNTIAVEKIYGYGAVTVASDTLVSTHMGTQLGIFSRILMTLICVAVIWSIISAVVMYTKRRRKGSLGLPRRPVDVRLAKGMMVLAAVLALVYPLWGVTVLLVLLFDWLVIRKVPKLRTTFGQR